MSSGLSCGVKATLGSSGRCHVCVLHRESIYSLVPFDNLRFRFSWVFPGGRFEIPVCRLVDDRITVDVGESVEFHCIASGTPEPQIEWTRPGGARLPTDAVIENGYLRIRRVRMEDQGEYICTALNSAGQAHVTGILVVEGKSTN